MTVPLAFPTGGDWRSAVLDDIERLIGVLAAAQSTGWLHDLVDLVGWSLDAGPHPHRLSLAALAIDPAAELSAWGQALIHDADLVARATSSAAKVLTGSQTGLAGSIRGVGSVDDPWVLDLGMGADGPSLSLGMSPDGPVRVATTTASALMSWRPGMPGLPPAGLGSRCWPRPLPEPTSPHWLAAARGWVTASPIWSAGPPTPTVS